MDNLRYYEASRAVPQNAQKSFDNGTFSGTDINPMWRIKKLTEMFGPAGIGWYVDVLSERSEAYDDVVMAIVDINLYVKEGGEWSKPIFGTGGNKIRYVTSKGRTVVSDEGYKMAFTDALGIACKSLGIGADIWFAKDVTKYAANSKPAEKPADKPIPMTKPSAQEEMPTPDELADLYELIPDEDSRRRMQEMYGDGFERMTRKAYNAILAKCQRLKEAGA